MAGRFDDTEQLLFRGFLLMPTILAPKVAPIPILFKSMTESEYETITTRYYYVESNEEKFLYYVAYSIAEIAGKNILSCREQEMDDLIDVIRDWPPDYFQSVTQLIDNFRIRISKAMDLLEPYAYTVDSQTKWRCYRNHLLNDPKVTGWEGTQYIRLSSSQQTWILLNSMDEDRKQYEMLNDVGRLMATATNPKGMKDVNNEEVERRRQIAEYRKNLVDADKPADLSGTNFMHPEKFTPQELVEQLKRMERGELDEHDLIVQEYERNLKQVFIDEKRRKEELMVNQASKYESIPSGIASISRAISDEELELRRQAIAERNGRGVPENKPLDVLAFDKSTAKKFAAMAKMEDADEEEYLHRDLFQREPEWGEVPQQAVYKAKSYDYYAQQQAAFRKEVGVRDLEDN